jgi:hypothetical protein
MNPGIVSIRRTFRTRCANTRSRIKGDSARNYDLVDKESTGGMVIPPRNTSSWTWNPPEEYLFRWERPDKRRGIHLRLGFHFELRAQRRWLYPIKGKRTDNSAGSYQLIYVDSDQWDQNERKILRKVTIPGSAASNPLYCQRQLKKILSRKPHQNEK